MASSPHSAVSGASFDGLLPLSHVDHPSRCAGGACWTLPGEARLLIGRESVHCRASIGNRHYDGLPDIAVVGPTSRPRMLWSDGEKPVEITLSALDWCGLTGAPADRFADRIVAADQIGLAALADDLAILLRSASDDAGMTGAARTVIARHIADHDKCTAPHIRTFMTIVDEGRIVDAGIAAEHVGVAPHALRRLALRQFGFPAKTVLIRRRFLIALKQFEVAGMDMTAAIACGYFDASHFLRDAKRFLGMTPRRFIALTGDAHTA